MREGKCLCGIGVTAALGFLLVLGACAPTWAADGESTGAQAMREAEKSLMASLEPLPEKGTGARLGAIESTLSNPFWITMEEGYRDAAREYGAAIDVQATATETDLAGQLDIMKQMIGKKYDAVSVSPLTEQNLLLGVVEANESGVKVVTVGNGVNREALAKLGGHVDIHVTTDFRMQGELGAQYIIGRTGGKGKVAVIEGIPGATQSEARKNGAVEAFKKAGMDLIAVQAANFDRRQAYDLTAALADANPDLAGISCGNDIMALGAVEALKKKGMKDRVVVVGVDFIEEAKASIERGELDATVAMSPYLLGKAGTILSLKALRGDTFGEDVVWTPIKLVDRENVASMEGWR